MNYSEFISSEHRRSDSFLNQLPTLGPLQMICDYAHGGKALNGSLKLSHTIGTPDQFHASSLISLDSDGKLVVFDPVVRHIHVFEPKEGSLLRSIPCFLSNVCSFTAGPKGDFYFTHSDFTMHIFPKEGCSVVSNGQTFKLPIGVFRPHGSQWSESQIAFSDDSYFLLTSCEPERQLLFLDQNGQVLTKRDIQDPDLHTFQRAVTWDSVTGNFLVVESKERFAGLQHRTNLVRLSYNSRLGIYRYNKDTNSLDFIGYRTLANPDIFITGLSIDRRGNLAVAHKDGVDIYSVNGALTQTVPCPGVTSVAVDTDANLYIFDGQRISVFH